MSQAELDAIWKLVVMGQKVDDWGGHDHSDIHTLTCLSKAALWARRKSPIGLWIQMPRMGDNA